MPTRFEGDLLARDAKIGVVVGRFNDFITTRLLDGAVDCYTRHGGGVEHLTVAHVPGSFEIPVVAMRLARSHRVDAVVCLGCVIRGATSHYDHVAGQAVRGIGQVGLETGVPTVLGVLTADTLEQAIERAGTKQGNQGFKAMVTAIEMVNLLKQIEDVS